MMFTADDYIDIGTLISFGLQPNKRPSNEDYRRTLNRYITEPDFRDAVDGVLMGLSAQALAANNFGLILGVAAESPFAFRLGDMPNTQEPWKRMMAGLVLMGLAAYAFPSAEDLEDDRIRQLQDIGFEQWLRAACQRLKVRDTAGEVISEDGLDRAWRIYAKMPAVAMGDKGRGKGRLTFNCTLYWVRTIINWLSDQGMARPDSVLGEGHWYLTERFRIQVKYMGAGSAYTYLRDLDRATAAKIQDQP